MNNSLKNETTERVWFTWIGFFYFTFLFAVRFFGPIFLDFTVAVFLLLGLSFWLVLFSLF